MTRSELKRLRALGEKMRAAKENDYSCVVRYSLTEPTMPTYSIEDQHGKVIAWNLSVDTLIAGVESILPTGEELPK